MVCRPKLAVGAVRAYPTFVRARSGICPMPVSAADPLHMFDMGFVDDATEGERPAPLRALLAVVLLATIGLMSSLAGPFMKKVREGTTRWADGSYAMPDVELEALLRGSRPRVIAFTGIAGLAILLWLMVYKPGA